jgi:hypothetical protein
MKEKNLWGTCLAIILLASGAGAQQSGTPPKTEEGGSSPPTSTGTAATPPAAASSQKVVLKVGATKVTQSEIDALISKLGTPAKAMVARRGRRPVGEEYVKMLLLSRRALDEHLDSLPALRSQLELQRAETLAEAEYQKMSSEVKVSQEEVGQHFTAHRSEFEAVQVREFLIRKRAKGAEDAKLGLTAEDAKAKAESIRKALVAGTDVEKVDEDFADPPNVLMIDRKPRTLRRGEMVPDLEKAVFQLEDGGVSEPVDTPQVVYVVKVLKHQHPELKEVATEIEDKFRQQKLDAEMDHLREKAGVWMDEEYFKGKPEATPGSAVQPPASPGTPRP